LARDDRVSLTIDHDTAQVMEITGLSMAAHAQPVFDRAVAEKVLRMLPQKYPEQVGPAGTHARGYDLVEHAKLAAPKPGPILVNSLMSVRECLAAIAQPCVAHYWPAPISLT
jgi:hypothetical protein